MKFLRRLFGMKDDPPPAADDAAVPGEPDDDMIHVVDEYGRPAVIPRDAWRTDVLPRQLKDAHDDPDKLYGVLVSALEDGFADDIIPAAQHLAKTDTDPARGATMLGVIYMETRRPDDAEREFTQFMEANGEVGVMLTNLAKLYARRGDLRKSAETLWHGLEVDPNQDSGLLWYVAMAREALGEQGERDALHRVSSMPGSCRAQLWIARRSLDEYDVDMAMTLYRVAIERGGSPVPDDMLMQISGDLGNHSCFAQVVELVEPLFDPAVHGLAVGNNLIKCHHDLGELDEAREILNQMFAQNRPDWQQTLAFWDSELAKAEVGRANDLNEDDYARQEGAVSLCPIERPLWAVDESPLATLLQEKAPEAIRIGFIGSSVVGISDDDDEPHAQLSDAPGRLSRAVPLRLAEHTSIVTTGVGIALMVWADGRGFAVTTAPPSDETLAGVARGSEAAFDLVVVVGVDVSGPKCAVSLALVTPTDGTRVAEETLNVDLEQPGESVELLVFRLESLLVQHAGVQLLPTHSWYQPAVGIHATDYLLRLEQQLAVVFESAEGLDGGGMHGEREIINGTLRLCLNHPANPLMRMMLAQLLRQMHKSRPAIVAEFAAKVDRLQTRCPLEDEAGMLAHNVIADVMSQA